VQPVQYGTTEYRTEYRAVCFLFHYVPSVQTTKGGKRKLKSHKVERGSESFHLCLLSIIKETNRPRSKKREP
jgi:hypothetical protein